MPEISPLETLLHRSDIWRASSVCDSHASESIGIPSGLRKLDKALHHRGWPSHGLTELLLETPGSGELRLLSPSLARLSQQPGLLVLVAPPYIPYAPGLFGYGIDVSRLLVVQLKTAADILWATEQALGSGACSSVLSWLPESGVTHKHLRKLQLAAQQSHGVSVLVRPSSAAHQASPAALRIAVTTHASQLQLDILKQRGGWAGQQVNLALPNLLARQQLPVGDLPVYNRRISIRQPASPGMQPLADLHAFGHNMPSVIH